MDIIAQYITIQDVSMIASCIVVAYIIHLWHGFKWLDDKYIPLILALLGGIESVFIHNIDYFGIGMLVGLISNSCYSIVDLIIQYINEKAKNSVKN